VQILGLLVEGNKLRATSRLADVSINTVTKLLGDAGEACAKYQDKALRNLTSKRIQCDEIWSFCYPKEQNVPADKRGIFGYGDVWTWVALNADTKLVPAFMVGTRGARTAHRFMNDLATRLANRVQLTTDGHRVYLTVVENAFGADFDYAMLVKIYSADSANDTRYNPTECVGCQTLGVTNAFSKKVENHVWMLSLHYMHHNFSRIHKTLHVTPAMAAGITDHVWDLEEILQMADRSLPKPGKRGPYQKRNSN
jgi:hypothetical protein